MERKGLLVGAVVLVLLALGLGIWINREESTGRASSDDDESEAASGSRGGVASASPIGDRDDGEPGSRSERPRSYEEDGGVPQRVVALPSGLPGGQARMPAPRVPENQRAVADSEETTGWRLGQARQRISVLEPRIERMQALVAGFEERGETAAAERQRTIMQRFETRLGELRTEVTDLEAQATADGTLRDAERGFQESAQTGVRSAVPGIAPPPPPTTP